MHVLSQNKIPVAKLPIDQFIAQAVSNHRKRERTEDSKNFSSQQ